MATYKMKIRPHFIDSIKSGTKKHEYRLAESERRKIQTGDILILVSNQNPKDYVRVCVDDIHIFSNWDDALRGRWENDFKDIYPSYNDLIRECRRFYSAGDVAEKGIIVFGIRPDKIVYKSARYLFDTNIIIHRESHDEALPIAGKMYRWIDAMGGVKLFHPVLRKELEKYEDKKIAKGILDKLSAYQELVPVPKRDSFFEGIAFQDKDENSINDSNLLLQVHSGRVDFLITEDKGILRKAEALFIRNRVMTIEEFVHEMERSNPTLVDYEVLSIKKDYIGELDFKDPFFDSLKEDYGYSDFESWLNRKSGETAYIFKNKDGRLEGFLYLKQEDESEPFSDFEKPMKKQKWLKVGTFKNAVKGRRVGERFLKIIFDNALRLDVDGIYVTLFERKREEVRLLMELMKKWGFVPFCHKTNGELVMVKEMRHYDEEETSMFNYPLQKKHPAYTFIPIEAKWHGKLFPDLHLRNENMSIYENEPCSYAVEKIYVCGWREVKAVPGDIAFIYRMGEYSPKKYHSVVSGMAIIEEIFYPNTEAAYLDAVKNKSVFTEEELKSFYREKKYRTVVKLLFLRPFRNKLTLQKLNDLGVLGGTAYEAPRMNTFIAEDAAKKIIEEGERE